MMVWGSLKVICGRIRFYRELVRFRLWISRYKGVMLMVIGNMRLVENNVYISGV